MDEFIIKLKEAMGVEFFEDQALEPSTIFRNLSAWDSLAVVSIIVLFQVEYDTSVSAVDLASCSTVADLYALVKN